VQKDIFLRVVLGIGIWFIVAMLFGVWEYNILKAEIGVVPQLIAALLPHKGGVLSYMMQMIHWTVVSLILGLVWAKVLFPKRPLMERIMFSLVFGVFIMPISFMIPYTAITITTVFSIIAGITPPAFVNKTLGDLVNLLLSNKEQVYEVANSFGMLILGAVILLIKSLMPKNYGKHT
jgi:hypothetical protein